MIEATLAQIHNKKDINNTDHTNTTTTTIFHNKLPETVMETPKTKRKDMKQIKEEGEKHQRKLGHRQQQTNTTKNISNSVTTSIIKFELQKKPETTIVTHNNNQIIPTTTKNVQNIVKEYDEITPKKENKYTTTPNKKTEKIIDQITATSNNTDIDFKKITQQDGTQIEIEDKAKTSQEQQQNDINLPTTQNNTSKNNLPKPVPKTGPPPQVIVDNIITTKTDEQIIQNTKNIFKDKIKNIRILKLGGMLITPSDHAATNSLLKANNYPTATYGPDLYIHLTTDKTDTRPWLCVNQVEYNKDNEHTTLQDIKQIIQNIKTPHNDKQTTIEGLHRKQKGPLTTTLLLFKTTDDITQNHLTNTKIQYNNKILTIRVYIDKRTIQCSKCQQLGHLQRQCHNKPACVRCAGTCPQNNCKSGDRRNCVNCNGHHASTSKQCPELKKHIKHLFDNKKTQSYAQILGQQQTELHKEQQNHTNQINTITTQQINNNKLNETKKYTTNNNRQYKNRNKKHEHTHTKTKRNHN